MIKVSQQSKTKKSVTNVKIPELLAPVGNWAMLRTAVNAGADAVYLGVSGFNMRATAKNFKLVELKKIVTFCHENDVRIYLTINIIIYEPELPLLKKVLDTAKKNNVDGIICWDNAVIFEAKKRNLDIHISTQASISNAMSAEFYKSQGASRCVLARECTLEQIKKIRKKTTLKIEAFGHGAMCVSVSGRCFMSQFLYGRSANRGDCIQPCRRAFSSKVLIQEHEEGKALELGNDFVMSPKDLCTLPFLDKLAPYIDSLKIEGRARSPEYVDIVIKVYREALTAIAEHRFSKQLVDSLMKRLGTVYNRGFSNGFYMGKPIHEFTTNYGSSSSKRKVSLGKVNNYFKKIGVAEIEITANSLKIGDTIVIIGDTTGTVMQTITTIEWNHKPLTIAKKGKSYAIKVNSLVRKNDAVYLWK